MANKVIFHLNLMKVWFDMVGSNIKKHEYRNLSSWSRTFVDGKIKIKGKLYNPEDVIICFSNGYAKDRYQLFVECKALKVGPGKAEWGAKKGDEYFILVLGEILLRYQCGGVGEKFKEMLCKGTLPRTPYLKEIMDSIKYDEPAKMITIEKPSSLGFSTSIVNYNDYII